MKLEMYFPCAIPPVSLYFWAVPVFPSYYSIKRHNIPQYIGIKQKTASIGRFILQTYIQLSYQHFLWLEWSLYKPF